jgi:uncharacterized membrane protein YphA (DoxX/SURF4 family)
MKLSRVAGWTCTVILALVFVLVGVSKLATASAVRWSERFSHWGYPAAGLHVLGVIEVVAGVGLLVPKTQRVAAGTVVVVMIGALGTHLLNGELARIIPPLVLGALALLVYQSTNRKPLDLSPK